MPWVVRAGKASPSHHSQEEPLSLSHQAGTPPDCSELFLPGRSELFGQQAAYFRKLLR